MQSSSFSWRDVRRSSSSLPPGKYAADPLDQHANGWCGSCYVVAAVQCVEDRAYVARVKQSLARDERTTTARSSLLSPLPPRLYIHLQAVLDHHKEEDRHPGWNACHGGVPLRVFECLQDRCPLQLTYRGGPARAMLGHPRRDAAVSPSLSSSSPPILVTDAQRVPHASVRALLLRDGPVVLEVNARTLKSVDARGRVQDLTPRPSNHAVCVVGWEGDCWIVRNSWGTHRVPVDVPEDVACVSEDGNACEVRWERWVGDPRDPGTCLLPMAFAPLDEVAPCPWVVPTVVWRG